MMVDLAQASANGTLADSASSSSARLVGSRLTATEVDALQRRKEAFAAYVHGELAKRLSERGLAHMVARG